MSRITFSKLFKEIEKISTDTKGVKPGAVQSCKTDQPGTWIEVIIKTAELGQDVEVRLKCLKGDAGNHNLRVLVKHNKKIVNIMAPPFSGSSSFIVSDDEEARIIIPKLLRGEIWKPEVAKE